MRGTSHAMIQICAERQKQRIDVQHSFGHIEFVKTTIHNRSNANKYLAS